eukprot:7549877-Lingulodinium_polyedra.AAC.1
MRPEHKQFVSERERESERDRERGGEGRGEERRVGFSTQTNVAQQRMLRLPVPGARAQKYVSIWMWHG